MSSDLNSLKEALEQCNLEKFLSLINSEQEESININSILDGVELTAFEYCLILGNVSIAEKIIDLENFDLNCKEHNPLRCSIIYGYTELAKKLIEKGCNPNYREENKKSLLYLCLERGYFDLAQLLVSKGAEINSRDENGFTALIYAAYTGKSSIVDFLLKNKALVDICNNEGWNAVVGAFANGNTEIVDKLLAAGAHFQESYAQAALLNSYINGNIKVAKSLLENGVSPNFTDKKSECLLIVALEKGDYDFAKLLVEKGADPNSRTKKDRVPALSYLAANGQDELIKFFKEKGADLNLASKYGNTPFLRAVRENQLQTVKVLAELGANINATDSDGVGAAIISAKNE